MNTHPANPLRRAPGLPAVFLIGLGGAVGSARLSLESLGDRFQLAPSKIEEKTGITGLQRLAPGESLVELARATALRLLQSLGLAPERLAGVFGSSNPTGENLFPSLTAEVAQALGLRQVVADHVGTGCCGGMQALRNAYNQLVVDGLRGRRAHYLLVAGDQTSLILDPARKQTGTLFGEGVAVAVLTNDPEPSGGYEVLRVGTRSLLGPELGALRLGNPFRAPPGAPLPRLEMEGQRVFEFGVGAVAHFLELLELERLPEGAYLVPHQPNLRMLEAMIARAGLDPARVYLDGIRTIGNTSGPAALLGLEDALRRRLVADDAPVVLGAFGAELQVGAALLAPRRPRQVLAPDFI